MRKISLNEKLVVYFVMIGVLGILIVSTFAYYNSRRALLSRTFDQLTSVRVNNKKQVEAFFQDRLRDLTMMAATDEIIDLAQQVDELPSRSRTGNTITLNEYLYAYLKNSGYFRRLILLDQSGANLIFSLLDKHSATFYAVAAESGLIPPEVAERSFYHEEKIHDIIKISEPLQSSLFISSPVAGTSGDCVLLLELSLSEISRIMLENNPRDGLGESGESYIVAGDTLLRSQSRFQPHSVMSTFANTHGFRQAQMGKTDIAVIEDYRGVSVLSSYGPMDIPGLDWVILAEIDIAEAMAPVNDLRTKLLLFGMLILILIFGFAFIFSRRITSPIVRLNNAAGNIGTGRLDVNLPILSNDEIGELTETFNKMALQLKHQKEALDEERKMRLRSMIDGQEKERQRLSRDLHDGLGQSLIAIKLQLESLGVGLEKGQNERMEKIKHYFEQTIEDIRRMSNDLAPSVLEEFGLTTALRNLCQSFANHSGPIIKFETSGVKHSLSNKTGIYLYRICQEALSNAVKHAEASQIEVLLAFEKKKITVQIKDNGKGFKIENAQQCRGNGINNIYERVQLLQGFVQIITDPGKGTRVRIECKTNN